MPLNRFALLLAINVAFALPAVADTIVFNLRDTSATADIEDGTISRGSVTAILTPLVSGGGVFNQTASGFGVNASASGDVTDQLDSGAGSESISIIFDTDLFFIGLGLSDYSGSPTNDLATLTIAGIPAPALTPQGAASDIYSFSSGNFVLAGQTVVLAFSAGNGFSFDNFTVSTDAIGVPDVGMTLLFLGLPLFGLAAVARRQTR